MKRIMLGFSRMQGNKKAAHTSERLWVSGRQEFSPLAPLGLKILVRGGILQKPLPAAQVCFFFVCDSPESKLSLSRTKKPLTS